jgi:hypothetical protein
MLSQDGNFVIYFTKNYGTDAPLALWSTGTAGRAGENVRLWNSWNGNLVLDSDKGKLWSSNTSSGKRPFVVKMQDDCNLVMYDAENKAVWSSGTKIPTPPWICTNSDDKNKCPLAIMPASNKICNAKLEDTGNLVVLRGTEYLWKSGSKGKGTGPYRHAVQDDGNLVVYDSKNVAIWSSGTSGKGTGPFQLNMQDDCNFVLYDSKGAATWATGTSADDIALPENICSSLDQDDLCKNTLKGPLCSLNVMEVWKKSPLIRYF